MGSESEATQDRRWGFSVPPESVLVPAKFHPLQDEVSLQVNNYFLDRWPFPGEKARIKFLKAGFSEVTCAYFPLASDDRIHLACRLLTLLFLVDDMLEDISLQAGAELNERLMGVFRGDRVPAKSVAAELIAYDIWESMCAHDKSMAMDVLEPLFEFMRAQTDSARLKPMTLEIYLLYREKDVGRALLESLMRFTMRHLLHISPAELELAKPAALTCSKHLAVINDIWSYEKELKAAKMGHEEGGVLCTSVAIFAADSGLSIPAAKSKLYGMCRAWEHQFKEQEKTILEASDTPSMRKYLLGLEYQMSGNEAWSRSTERYSVV